MTEPAEKKPIELDPSRLQRFGLFGFLMLLVSSWIGLFLGALGMATTGVGIIPALGWVTTGFIGVPLFGMLFAQIGVSRARDSVIRQTNTELLPPEHGLTRAVAHLAGKLEIPTPLVGIYPDDDINAFAAGSSPHKAVVSFSKGLTQRMQAREILAIAAHELAHIVNRDMRRMQYSISFQNSLTWYAGWTRRGQAFLRWMLGTLGELVVMRLSRSREYWADATAAAIVGKEAMISALKRLEDDPVMPSSERLAYARMMVRMNPHAWFDTHPSTADRIAALEHETYMSLLPMRVVKQDAAPPLAEVAAP